jgi:hypothetical protein
LLFLQYIKPLNEYFYKTPPVHLPAAGRPVVRPLPEQRSALVTKGGCLMKIDLTSCFFYLLL